jgi:hypothetical protein
MFRVSQFWDQRAKVLAILLHFCSLIPKLQFLLANLIKLKIDFFHKNFEMKPILIGIILGWVILRKL